VLLIVIRWYWHSTGIQSIVCRPTLSGNLISSPPSQTEWAVGATIRFGCTGGLVLQGERQAVCLASGNFNIPSYPVCIQPGEHISIFLVS